jgi:dnd system-associated protein 4
MADIRVKVAKDKAELVVALTANRDTTGPFQTYADAIAFAAAYGYHYRHRVPIREVAKKEPGPISSDIFIARGYDFLIDLIALTSTGNIQILQPQQPDFERQKLLIFEEYANGGLELLEKTLQGAINYTDRLLLAMDRPPESNTSVPEDFDLRWFLEKK